MTGPRGGNWPSGLLMPKRSSRLSSIGCSPPEKSPWEVAASGCTRVTKKRSARQLKSRNSSQRFATKSTPRDRGYETSLLCADHFPPLRQRPGEISSRQCSRALADPHLESKAFPRSEAFTSPFFMQPACIAKTKPERGTLLSHPRNTPPISGHLGSYCPNWSSCHNLSRRDLTWSSAPWPARLMD